jgi:hypothetical protein
MIKPYLDTVRLVSDWRYSIGRSHGDNIQNDGMQQRILCPQIFKKIDHIYRFADQPLLLPVSVITLAFTLLLRKNYVKDVSLSTKNHVSDVTRCPAVTVMQTNYVHMMQGFLYLAFLNRYRSAQTANFFRNLSKLLLSTVKKLP